MSPLKTFALSPVLLGQALWVAARASRLPEAAGPRTGVEGAGPQKRLLVLGDSSAAGVGVADQSDALAGQMARVMSSDGALHWNVIAKSGATVSSTLRTLETCPSEPVDFAIIALGVNDTKNGVRLRNWTRGYRELLEVLEARFGAPLICASGLPPLGDFPLLPAPLSDVLGARAAQFDEHLREIVAETPRAAYLPMHFPLDRSSMASDGFHPGPEVYRMWAKRAADAFADLEGR